MIITGLPLEAMPSQILIWVCVCIILAAIIFAIVSLFRPEESQKKGSDDFLSQMNAKIIESIKQEYIEKLAQGKAAQPTPEISRSSLEASKQPATPAAEKAAVFELSDLSISPAVVPKMQRLEISCRVTNKGNLSGSFNAELKINGRTVSTKTVTYAPGDSGVLSFAGSENYAGHYTVQIGNLTGTFTVF